MTETLRIDTPLVIAAGGRLEGLANAIPPPPAVFSPPGADPLSMAISGKVAEVVSPVVAALPVTKEELARYAQNVLSAANAYDNTDRQLPRRSSSVWVSSIRPEWHGRGRVRGAGRRRCGRGWRSVVGGGRPVHRRRGSGSRRASLGR